MKHRAQGKSATIRRVTLYFDDIEKILNLITDNCEEIRAYGDGYEFERPEEIDEYKELSKTQFDSLKIIGRNPDIRITVSQAIVVGGIWINIDEDDPKTLGLFTAIAEIIKERQNKFSAYYNTISAFLIITAILIGIIFYLIEVENLRDTKIVYLILWGWLAIRWLTTDWKTSQSQVKYRHEYSHQKTNFFVRKRDELILIVISSGVTLAITLLVQYLSGKAK